jgi:hypothetical protein
MELPRNRVSEMSHLFLHLAIHVWLVVWIYSKAGLNYLRSVVRFLAEA